MDLHETGNLLEIIAVHYPAFGKQISKDGKMDRLVAEEWLRIIGFLSYDEAIARLDAYIADERNTRPPRAHDLKMAKAAQRQYEYYHSDAHHQWHLEFRKNDLEQLHGRLFDEEGREFVHDPQYEDGYHYNMHGQICTIDGRVFA